MTLRAVPFLLAPLACQVPGTGTPSPTATMRTAPAPVPDHLDTITLGAGCFWCVEAVFEEMKGVHSVVSGYMGGHVEDPGYREVCTGRTGHAEVVQVAFDPAVVSVDEVLEVFWATHDPTTLNRQGADVGTQYRSAVFHHTDAQREKAVAYKAALDASGAFPRPIVTEIVPATAFYRAEEDHQAYYANNPEQAYCRMVVRPKLDKFRKVFADKLRTP